MAEQKQKSGMSSRRRIIVGILVTSLVILIAFSLFVALYPRPYSGEVRTWYDWSSKSTHYSGFSSTGSFLQVGYQLYTLVGTDANGSVTLFQVHPQTAQNLWWQKSYGRGSGNAVCFTNDGGYMVVGTNSSETERLLQNASLLIRTDANGNLLWSKNYEGLGFTAVVNASDGGFVALGSFEENGAVLSILLKVDASGNVLWNKTYTSSEAPVLKLTELISTNDGGYAMVGEMQYSIYNVTMRNGWFVKTNANGDAQINRPFSMNGACVLRSVVQADDGGYLLVGATSDSSNGTYLACVLGTDWDGHMQWSTIHSKVGNLTGSGFEYYSATKYQNGTYAVVGYLNGAGTTIENVDLNGTTTKYEVLPDAPQVNYIVTSSETIPPNQSGYVIAGYKDGDVWLYSKTPYTVTAMPEKA
jgi:hypothetical protein